MTTENSFNPINETFNEKNVNSFECDNQHKFLVDLNQNSSINVNSSSVSKLFKKFKNDSSQSSFLISNDFRICLFASALYSLKSISLLKPYPIDYYDSRFEEIDRDKLIETFENVPKLNELIVAQSEFDFEPKSIELLHWIITNGYINLEYKLINDLESKAKNTLVENISVKNSLRPNFVFQLKYPEQRAKAIKFENLKSLHGSFYAFHGSSFENFHSIVHNGLAISLNKRSLFGFGIYLSSKLSVAIQYSPFSLNRYHKSLFGRKMSCVALCEVINHPDVQAKKKRNGVPDTYYVVSNNELVRVSYLLLYTTPDSVYLSDRQSTLYKLKQANTNGANNLVIKNSSHLTTFSYTNLVLVLLLLTFVLFGFIITNTDLNIFRKLRF